MTQFWMLLYSYLHSGGQAMAVDGNGVVHYGGSWIQAFLYCLETGYRLVAG
jgi:hypothetical protein